MPPKRTTKQQGNPAKGKKSTGKGTKASKVATRSRRQGEEEEDIKEAAKTFSYDSGEEEVSDEEVESAKNTTVNGAEAINKREAEAAAERDNGVKKKGFEFDNDGLSSDESEDEEFKKVLEAEDDDVDYFKQKMIEMNKTIKKQAKEIFLKGKMYDNLKNKTSSSSSTNYGKKLDDGQKKFLSTFTNLHVWQRIKLFEPDRITFDANKDIVDMMFRQLNVTGQEDKEEIESACFAFIKEKINQKRGNVKQSIEKDYLGT